MFYSMSLLVFIAFACLIQNGFPLKCYICGDHLSNSTIPSCKSPKNMWAVKECPVARPEYDRCLVYRSSDKTGGVEEIRECFVAATCAHYWLSCQSGKKHNASEICDIRCCESNLCNKGELEPPKYEFFKPSGTDLSCYTCSDFPGGTRLAGSPVYPVPRNCTSPVKQRCGRSLFGQYMIQDRCITLKVRAIFRNKTFDWKYRGCSNIYHCSYTEAFWGYQLNKTSKEDRAGIGYLWGKSSCCHGNLCNSTMDNDNNRNNNGVHSAANVEHLSTGLTGFLCVVATAMIKAYIG